MGTGARKPKPARSEVVGAIEELLVEYEETNALPRLITPGIPQEMLDQWDAEDAEEEEQAALKALAKAGTPAVASDMGEGPAALDQMQLVTEDLAGLGLLADGGSDVEGAAVDASEAPAGGPTAEPEPPSGDDDILAGLLGELSTEDDLLVDGDDEFDGEQAAHYTHVPWLETRPLDSSSHVPY